MRDTLKSYGETPNDQLLKFIGSLAGTVVDVGCGSGAWGTALRAIGGERILGVEPDVQRARQARERYDVVYCDGVVSVAGSVFGEAKTVIMADVLEHLKDPWGVLRRIASFARPDTRLVVSVPNLRNIHILRGLVLNGRFDYSPAGGLMDDGHVRWFTSKSLSRSLEEGGWHVSRVSGSLFPRAAQVDRITGRLASDFLRYQVFVDAWLKPGFSAGPS